MKRGRGLLLLIYRTYCPPSNRRCSFQQLTSPEANAVVNEYWILGAEHLGTFYFWRKAIWLLEVVCEGSRNFQDGKFKIKMCIVCLCLDTRWVLNSFMRTLTRVLLTLRRSIVDESADVEGISTQCTKYNTSISQTRKDLTQMIISHHAFNAFLLARFCIWCQLQRRQTRLVGMLLSCFDLSQDVSSRRIAGCPSGRQSIRLELTDVDFVGLSNSSIDPGHDDKGVTDDNWKASLKGGVCKLIKRNGYKSKPRLNPSFDWRLPPHHCHWATLSRR